MTDIRLHTAESLLRWGACDEVVERSAGVPLLDILALRARLATPTRNEPPTSQNASLYKEACRTLI